MKKKITLIILVVIAVFSISLGVRITTLDSDNKKEETKNKEENKIKTYEIMLKTTYYKEGTEIKYRKTKKDGTYIYDRYKNGEIIESYEVSSDGETIINSQRSEYSVG